MFILSTPSFSSEEIISLKISDLEKWIRIYSPEMKISGNEKKNRRDLRIYRFRTGVHKPRYKFQK